MKLMPIITLFVSCFNSKGVSVLRFCQPEYKLKCFIYNNHFVIFLILCIQFFFLIFQFVIRQNTTKKTLEDAANTSMKAETPVEKKKNFYQYKNRDGPTALGTKELPVVCIY